jgi:hypothetical protein
MNELIDKTRQWFHAKEIIQNSNPLKQLEKTQEELTETRDAAVRYDYLKFLEASGIENFSSIEDLMIKEYNDIKDGIGDTVVTLIGVCEMWNKDIVKMSTTPTIKGYVNDLPENAIEVLDELQVHLLKLYLFTATSNTEAAEVTMGMMVGSLAVLSEQYGTTLAECLQQAYDVISKRSGKMVNGKFVKDLV